MALSTQPYKGTRDFYPEDMRFRRWMFGSLRNTVEMFGYQEYDGPMLEPFELYAAKSGEELVNQQLYWMMDRGDRKLAVRPEMTPTLARIVAAKINELPRPIRLFSIPNLWRYERPQRGRLREHWQLNVDLLGGDPILADAEILSVALEVVGAFGGADRVSIRVNNRRLMDAFFREKLGLSAEATLATTKAVDARAKIGEEAYAKWLGEIGVSAQQKADLDAFFQCPFEKVAELVPGAGVDELGALFTMLRESGFRVGSACEEKEGKPVAQVVFDPTVMRGLDYYTGTVFEVFDTSPENRRAMFGGGRYDNLVGLFGNHKLSGVGFGMGDVTLQHFLETHKLVPQIETGIDAFVTLPKKELREKAEQIARALRAQGLKVITPLSIDGFGNQLKAANKLGSRFAVLLGDTELAAGNVAVKDLKSGEQHTVAISELAASIKKLL